MSDKALALIFLNLSGEMLYVLDQRLFAQKITTEKGKKIMQDIVCNMFNERFLDEIFKPQEVCSKKGLRIVFDKLAHTSIMRLNESSMDKLYDLMTMAVKYQLSMVRAPREILLVTLNHLDTVMNFVHDSPICVSLIDACYARLFQTFGKMSQIELQTVRYTMFNFFQDLKIKVSIFLKEKMQNWNGTFVLFSSGPITYDSQVPGRIVYYETDRDTQTIFKESKFDPGARYQPPELEGSYERHGDRITKLGLNVYSSNKLVDTIVAPMESNAGPKNTGRILADLESNVPDPRAKAQLDLLCRMIGSSASSSSSTAKGDFKLNLFNNEEEEFIYNAQYETAASERSGGHDSDKGRLIAFDESKRKRDQRLNQLMDEFGSDTSRGRASNKSGQNASHARHKPQQDYDDYNNNNNNDDDDDDDDDIVTMMDKLNR